MHILRRLFVPIIMLLIGFTAISGVIILIGRAQPLPEPLAMLHLTDCAPPCWIGIVPGKTTREEAAKRIEAVFSQTKGYKLSHQPGSITLIPERNSVPYQISIACFVNEEDVIFGCALFWENPLPVYAPTIGQIQALLETPGTVIWDDNSQLHLGAVFTKGFVWGINADGKSRLTPDMQVTGLYFVGQEIMLTLKDFQRGPWRGFASFDVYKRTRISTP